ncbi:MAG: flagellar hook-length control protein FliK [Lachnospiraceae bacterium]
MTSKIDMGFLSGNLPPNVTSVKNVSEQSDGFHDIMNQIAVPTANTGKTADFQAGSSKPEELSAAQSGKTSVDTASKHQINSASEEKATTTLSKNQDSDRKEAVAEAEDRILTETAEELGITEEELQDILEQMGLTVFDLLEPENVSALVAKVLGDGDMMTLVTDETLSGTVLELNAMMKEIGAELSKELGMEEADLKSFLADLAQETVEEIPIQEQNGETLPGQKVDNHPVNEAAVTDKALTEDGTLHKVSEISDEEPEAISESLQQTETDSSKDAGTENFSSDSEAGAGNSLAEHMTERVQKEHPLKEDQAGIFQQTLQEAPVVQDMAMEAVRELTGSSPTEILEQIQSHIRQNTTAQITEWEMQLNPENLGTVGLNVSTKEGVVTAHFTTQNEAVKAVMEAQIMVLKENLEQQGIKIEAVEVTVATHQFEQNLQKGDDSNEQMEREQEKLRKATRRIDLGEWVSGEELEALDEAERVTAEMMQADGNRMDYKV